jgi:hypothetical protein
MNKKVIVLCQERDREQVSSALKKVPNLEVLTTDINADIHTNIDRICQIKQKINEKLNYYSRPAI